MVWWSCCSLLWTDRYGEEANNLMKQLLLSNQQVLFFSSALIMRNWEERPITQGRISLLKKITSAQPQGTSDGHFHRTASPMFREGNTSTWKKSWRVCETDKKIKTKGNSQCPFNRRKIPECRGSLNERSEVFSIFPSLWKQNSSRCLMSWPTWIPTLKTHCKILTLLSEMPAEHFWIWPQAWKTRTGQSQTLKPHKACSVFHKYTTLFYGFYGLSFSWNYKNETTTAALQQSHPFKVLWKSHGS